MKFNLLLILFAIGICSNFIWAADLKFNHQFHIDKVFLKYNFSCANCHNIENVKGKEFKASLSLNNKTFKVGNREMCHQCHQGSETSVNNEIKSAPKACTNCHDTSEKMQNIKPLNHQNANWKNGSHATQARIETGSCLNCHSNNTCISCHASRNKVQGQNHSKNYRYYHSIEARMNAARCDSCHSQSYCTSCHSGAMR